MSMMLALSSPTSMFPNNMEWPLELEEEELSHSHHEYFNSEEYPLLSSSMAKKFNHNASERHRRKKINALYSSLRSILPELQQQVEELIKKKEELLLRISRQGDINNDDAAAAAAMNKKGHHRQNSSGFLVSSSRISDSEVSIQIISSYGIQKCQVSEILVCLENHYALQLLNASSFDTFGGRLFYNLHFQMEMAHTLDTEVLSEKILSICEKHQRI